MDKVSDAKVRLEGEDPGPKAIALYAVAARDAMDFIDMVEEASDAVLVTLHGMMSLKSGDSENDKVNALMLPVVARALEGRGVDTRLDNCEVCLGAKGGVRGNENVIGGVIVCDYCHAAGDLVPRTTESA